MKDYLGHEIHIGDILLYNQKASKGYYSSFEEGIVLGENKGRVLVCSNNRFETFLEQCDNKLTHDVSEYVNHVNTDCKYPNNTINLTALDIRQNEIYRLPL